MHQDPRYHQQWTPQQYQQPPHPRMAKSVEKRRGLGGMANSTHLLLTLLTCGMWLFIWIPWWLFRMIVPRRKVTRTYYR